MEFTYSDETDQAYIDFVGPPRNTRVKNTIVFEGLKDDLHIDLDGKGRILGLEFPYNARSMLPPELFGEKY